MSTCFNIFILLLVTRLYVIGEKAIFPITVDDVEKIDKALHIPLLVLTPKGSPYDNTNLNIKDGLLSYLVSLVHALDDYVINPTVLNPPYELLNIGGLNKLFLVRLVQGSIIFINETDYKFAHSGLENYVINCLKDLYL